jgi:hypothetical protein
LLPVAVFLGLVRLDLRPLRLRQTASGDSDEPPTLSVDKGKKVQWEADPEPSTSIRKDQSGHIVTDQNKEEQRLDEDILSARLEHGLDI